MLARIALLRRTIGQRPDGRDDRSIDMVGDAPDAAAVLLSLVLLPGILLAELTVPQGPFPHDAAVSTVAQTFAVALVASARCPDLFATTDIDQMQTAFGLTGADSPEILAVQSKVMAAMTADIDRLGASAWCNDVYDRFGPDGRLMKGLLKRCDPKLSEC